MDTGAAAIRGRSQEKDMSSIDRSRRLLTFGGLAAGTLGSFGAALATETYPSRAVTLLVALQAGSGSDVATRVLGEHLGTKFGVPFVVNNVPGAGGVLGRHAWPTHPRTATPSRRSTTGWSASFPACRIAPPWTSTR